MQSEARLQIKRNTNKNF